MAQTVQRRRHQEPAQLSRLAPRPRSLGRPSHSTKLDQKRHRKRAIPTTNAVRALDDIPIFSKRLFAFMALTAVVQIGDRGRDRFSPTPPSEPYGRFSRIRLSSRWFPHRECLADNQAV